MPKGCHKTKLVAHQQIKVKIMTYISIINQWNIKDTVYMLLIFESLKHEMTKWMFMPGS